jgi:hypothetical protein
VIAGTLAKRWLQSIASHKSDVISSTVIFVLVLVLFLFSRVHQLTDSNYSMLLSQSLLQHRSFTLDEYDLPRLNPTQQLFHVSVGSIYQLEYIDGHIYYFWPPGTSILSLPFVGLMNAIGVSASRADGSYDPTGEITIQARLAALLMALLAVLFYFTSRFVLPLGWSALLVLGGALGTQVWSTASRALWSETWGIFLLGLIIFMLVAEAAGRYSIRPILLATLLAWTYFVRPTFSVPIIAITIYILLFHRRLFLPYAAAGVAWFAVFVAYSWFHYHQLLPNYYLVYQHFGVNTLATALLGNLISPSRGLFVFVPSLAFVGYLLMRYRSDVPLWRLAVLSIVVVVIHLIVVSAHSPWYGGHCFGPRYSTGLVPWFYLLAVLAVTAWRKRMMKQGVNASGFHNHLEKLVGCILLVVSLTINALGATSHATWLWNSRPIDVDKQPDRVWDWKHPQFLAKWDH